MQLLVAVVLLPAFALSFDDQASKAFTARVGQYAKLRKAALDKVPPLAKAASPEDIVRYEKALVAAIRAARPQARQGEYFTPDSRPLFAAIIKQNLAGSTNAGTRQMAKQGNPTLDLAPGEVQPVVQVNAVYPKNSPVSTMPPLLLMQLPALPKDIEYRFVGRTLVLYDSLSNLIVDYLQEAAPGL